MRSFVPVSFLNSNKISEANTVPLSMVGLLSGVSIKVFQKITFFDFNEADYIFP